MWTYFLDGFTYKGNRKADEIYTRLEFLKSYFKNSIFTHKKWKKNMNKKMIIGFIQIKSIENRMSKIEEVWSSREEELLVK